ncbi:MAG TPA: hypothetical protein VEA60_13765 [Allosphingosinicella sp.]|nr:hypothetical protein [Allosphingosinicella sp.]
MTSTLTSAGAAEDEREPLDSPVVARRFGDPPWSERRGAASIAQRIAAETENLSRLIARIRQEGLCPRDLSALGYNSA